MHCLRWSQALSTGKCISPLSDKGTSLMLTGTIINGYA
uniref:Uncharacterized protein n=1 Tax=Anguilla anguilla TaxID=7936 RepID=A0A0E9U597_ANGAN